MKLQMNLVEDACKELYIRALKVLPDDIKAGIEKLDKSETDKRAQVVLKTMITNISVAEREDNLLCQDTGLPIYNVKIGRNVQFDGVDLKTAIRKGCERATTEHPLRSSVVHPISRKNNHTSCGIDMPAIHIDFCDEAETVEIEMVPKGSGSENNSFLKMAIPADGISGVKAFVIESVVSAGGKTCPPTIVGVGVGGTSDQCVAMAKRAAVRPLGSVCSDDEGAKLEKELSVAVNKLGIGPQGLGGDSTAYAVHVELAHTHITLNPVAVNMQCHSARRARATITPAGVNFGFQRDTMAHYNLRTPVSEEDIRKLRINDTVTLQNTLFGIRDATQIHMFDHGRKTCFDLNGHAVIHTAPNVRKVPVSKEFPAGYQPICIGTTTSDRMERFTRPLMAQNGVRMIVGKGGMREGSSQAFQELGGVYLAIIGGTAALETTWIEQIEDVDMDDLNPESLWRFKIKDFGPLLVAMDSHGGSIYQEVKGDVARNKDAVLKSLGINP